MKNIYTKLINDISHQNKYTKWYLNIISNAIERCQTKNDAKNILIYFEIHHIVPKSMKLGGDKDPNNLVFLSYREHFLVHMLLPKMIKDKEKAHKIACALTKMNINNINSKTFNTSKIIAKKYHISKLKSTITKRKLTYKEKYGVENNSQLPEYNKKCKITNNNLFGNDYASQSPTIKEKTKQTRYENNNGNFHSDESLEKSRRTRYKKNNGNFHSNESLEKSKQTCLEKYNVEFISQVPYIKNKISIGIKNSWTNKIDQIICPYCNISSRNISRMTQYHFEKCKLSPHYIPPELISCHHCNKTGNNTHQFRAVHFNNCKLSPQYIPSNLISCPHCEKIGLIPNMIQWHFDNCKFKK